MAQISINVDGDVEIQKPVQKGGCMMINLHNEMDCCGEKFTLSRDTVYLHAKTIAQMRAFFERCVAALPAEPVPVEAEPPAES